MIQVQYYGLVLVGTVIFCVGVVKLLKKPFCNLAIYASRQLGILLDRSLPEERRDALLLKNLLGVLKWLFAVIAIICLLIFVGILPATLFVYFHQNLSVDTSSIYFYGSMFLGSFALLFFKEEGDYSYWSKLLHTIILDNYALGRFLMEREIKKKDHGEPSNAKKFIMVTGLARGGTTALTNLIYDEGLFHAIKYANMPFLLSPGIWKKAYSPKDSKKKERAHGDRVLFGEDSIEAFEEYFFKAHLDDHYIHEHSLRVHDIPQDLLLTYYKYQDLFQQKGGTLYLAKNNNFILRGASILKQSAAASVLLIFRDPESHARSLLRQHENFVERQQKDEFVLRYMNWLGHHEFGLGQKQFSLSVDSDLAEGNDTKYGLSYWLTIWINYYTYILELHQSYKGIVLIHYQDLLEKPNELKKAVGSKIGVELSDVSLDKFGAKSLAPVEHDALPPDKVDLAAKIYMSLLEKKLKL